MARLGVVIQLYHVRLISYDKLFPSYLLLSLLPVACCKSALSHFYRKYSSELDITPEHIQSLMLFTSRPILEKIDGFIVGKTYGEAIASPNLKFNSPPDTPIIKEGE